MNQSRPKAFISENAEGLVAPRNSEAPGYIMDRIRGAGYHADYHAIDPYDCGVMQNRVRRHERLFPLQRHSQRRHSWDLLPTTERQKKICLLLLRNSRKKAYGCLDGNPPAPSHFQSLDKTKLRKARLKGTLACVETRYDFKNTKISTGLYGVNRVFLPGSSVFPTLVASDTNDMVATQDITAGCAADYKLPDSRARWMKLIGNGVSVPGIEALCRVIMATGVFGVNAQDQRAS